MRKLHVLMVIASALGLSVAQPGRNQDDASVRRFLKGFDNDLNGRFIAAFADLNGDGKTEAIVHLTSNAWCGTGGCTTLVLARDGDSWRILTEISITRLPIRVLMTKSSGWRSIAVWVQGGGIQPGYEAELRFDGKTYPANPSVSPARPTVSKAKGEVVIPSPDTAAMSVCDLSRDYRRFQDKLVTVRGIYYYGLRQECAQKCSSGIWPSFINLEGGSEEMWADIAKTQRQVEVEAKQTGKRFEIWVTVAGRLLTRSAFWNKGSQCDWARIGTSGFGPTGFGHMGAFPAQVQVEGFHSIEVKQNPKSPYDYANVYHGPM
jgi:hypothetical protein